MPTTDNDDLRATIARLRGSVERNAVYGYRDLVLEDDDLTALLDAAERAQNMDAVLEDRARFPDKPDAIGNMIAAHIENLKAVKEAAERHAIEAMDRALDARNAALEEAAKVINMTAPEIRLRAGEMSKQEMRTVQAVLTYCMAAIRALKKPTDDK